jgi:hypothetical protein
MSRENVEIVRDVYAAWERGNYSFAEWAHREIEFAFADGPAPGRWTGLAAMAEAMRDWLGSWEEFRQVADEYRELDDERRPRSVGARRTRRLLSLFRSAAPARVAKR